MDYQEGFRALWTGVGPNVARNAIINAAELASYDQVKQVKQDCHALIIPVYLFIFLYQCIFQYLMPCFCIYFDCRPF